jgi:tetratricopeptide (TPR) repeat protein
LLCLIAGTFAFYKRGLARLGAALLIVVMLIVLGLTYSRLGIFSFIIALTILAAFRYRGFMNALRARLIFLIPAAFLILTLIALSPVRKNMATRLLDSYSSDVSLYSCKMTLAAIKDYPLWGAGFENYYLFSKYAQEPITLSVKNAGAALEITRKLIWSVPHSLYLGIAFGAGLIGLTAFIWLLASLILYCLRLNNYLGDGYARGLLQGIFISLVAMIIHGTLAMTFHLTILPAFFWILAGLAVAIGNTHNFNQKIDYKLKPWQARAGLIIVFLMGMAVINPILAERYYIAARHNFQAGNLSQAAQEIILAKKLLPIHPEFYALSAEIQSGQGLIGAAIASYQKALRLRRNYAFYHARLGQLYRQKGAYSCALREFNLAILLDKQGAYYAEHYSDLGLLYAALGKKEEALVQFQKAALMKLPVVKNTSGAL